jgi:predicted RNA-binding Zn-ribbon protein involved in translation (DUF1610 family)
MPTIVYKARSQADLYRTQRLLSRNGIDSKVIGDPNKNLGPKVTFFVELAVDDHEASIARKIISTHLASENARIRPLTASIRRGVLLAILCVGPLIVFGLVFAPDILQLLIPVGLVGGLIVLPFIANRRASIRKKRRDAGSCEDCGYNLRGNRSGRCPECGTRVLRRHRLRRRRTKRR